MEKKLVESTRILLNYNMGDRKVLEQILRAATRGELISNHERDYVDSLISEYKGSHPDKKAATENNAGASSYVVEKPPASPKFGGRSLLFVVVGAAAAIAIIAVLALTTATTVSPPQYLVTQDSSSYKSGDFISISGLVDPDVTTVHISILDSGGAIAWTEQTQVRSNGSFSALVLAGYGDWKEGEYTLEADTGSDVYVSGFSYTP